MQTVIRHAVVLGALMTAPFLALHAQDHRPGIREAGSAVRQGFWGVFELGAGSESVNFDNDGLGYSDNLTRPVVALRAGGTVSRHLRLGGEVNAWINDESGITETVGGLLFIAQVYPWSRSGLFLKGGAGLGWSSVEDDFGGQVSDGGFAANLGIGYDLRIGRRLYLVPTANFNTYRLNGGAGGDYTERVGTLGLGIAFQH